MSIKNISTDELCGMRETEGLVLRGCGGDLEEWIDGINGILTDEGILREGTRFEDCVSFEHEGLICLLFPFDDNINLDVGRLAIWRLKTHDTFDGTWLSDFLENEFG